MKELRGQKTNQFPLAVIPIRGQSWHNSEPILWFLEIDKLPGPLFSFSQTHIHAHTHIHVRTLSVRTQGYNTSEHG